ncbi:non-specific serine/threonine protein kinase [Ranunculus cassubicifolius]
MVLNFFVVVYCEFQVVLGEIEVYFGGFLLLLRFRERVSRDPYGALLTWNFDEADEDPCSWDGIYCSDGKVTILTIVSMVGDSRFQIKLPIMDCRKKTNGCLNNPLYYFKSTRVRTYYLTISSGSLQASHVVNSLSPKLY